MGTFAGIFVEKEDNIPECKRDEFVNRIEKLYQAGGMMEIQPTQLYGKKVATIRKATMTESGMDFYYNYFEDDCWENAGFSRGKFSVWSNKIGWRHFHSAVVAAYVLEEMYTEGVSVSLVNGKPVTTWAYVAWINYLFDEKYHVKNYDPWKLFETFHYLEREYLVKEPLKYIISLMEEADDNYYQIYTFTEFFEETLENLYDKRYQILWKLYEEMLRDSELKKAGDVIFVPDGPEYENVGLHYWGEEPRRRLMNNWKSTDLRKRNNKARVTFRRYMALVANKELRRKVFGF